jgi:hypothetical protein
VCPLLPSGWWRRLRRQRCLRKRLSNLLHVFFEVTGDNLAYFRHVVPGFTRQDAYPAPVTEILDLLRGRPRLPPSHGIKPGKLRSAYTPNSDRCHSWRSAIRARQPLTFQTVACSLHPRHEEGFLNVMRQSEPAALFKSHVEGGRNFLKSVKSAVVSNPREPLPRTVAAVPTPQSGRPYRACCNR